MNWELAAVANAVIAIAYLAIASVIVGGLIRTGQLRSNRLGVATGLIFTSCGVYHAGISLHMFLPSLGPSAESDLDLRATWPWLAVVWAVLTAAIGIYYLTLRGSFHSVWRGGALYEDMQMRERQALEINDNIVQGLSVAKYALEQGQDEKVREAVDDTLKNARVIITELVGHEDGEINLRPGELRRRRPARVGRG